MTRSAGRQSLLRHRSAVSVSVYCVGGVYRAAVSGPAGRERLCAQTLRGGDRHRAPTLITFRVFVTTVLTRRDLRSINSVVQRADTKRNRVHNTDEVRRPSVLANLE